MGGIAIVNLRNSESAAESLCGSLCGPMAARPNL